MFTVLPMQEKRDHSTVGGETCLFRPSNSVLRLMITYSCYYYTSHSGIKVCLSRSLVTKAGIIVPVFWWGRRVCQLTAEAANSLPTSISQNVCPITGYSCGQTWAPMQITLCLAVRT